MKYTVVVAENSHYMDESDRYIHGEFNTAEDAIAAAKALVDADLESLYSPGMPADELYRHYTTFGRDPYLSPDQGCSFSAWNYAKEQCQKICDYRTTPSEEISEDINSTTTDLTTHTL